MKIENEVLGVLGRSEFTDGGTKLRLPGQLDRKLYLKTNKVIEALGGKWERKTQSHVFGKDAAAELATALEEGSVDVPKDEWDFYETPPQVIERMIIESRLQSGARCLEPSAGTGNIIRTLHRYECEVVAVEANIKMAELLMECVKEENLYTRDFLSLSPEDLGEKFDFIFMNPPFSKSQDVDHVLHALTFLRPGANRQLVAVMSAGIKFRETGKYKKLRQVIEDRGGEIQDLPPGSFKSSGTMVNTVIVIIPGARA